MARASPGGGGGGAGSPAAPAASDGSRRRGRFELPGRRRDRARAHAVARARVHRCGRAAGHAGLHPGALNPTFVDGVGRDRGRRRRRRLGPAVRGRAARTASRVSASSVGLSPDGAFSAAIWPLAEGVWTVQAVQFDIAGHEGLSNAVTFYFDRSGPQVEITWPGPVTDDAQTSIEGVARDRAPGDLEEVTVTVTGPGRLPARPSTRRCAVRLPRRARRRRSPTGPTGAVARQEDELPARRDGDATFVVDTVAPVDHARRARRAT